MNARPVFHLISFVPLIIGLCQLACWGTSHAMGDAAQAQLGLARSAALSIVVGLVLWVTTRGPVDLSRRDGVGIVTFGWLLTVLLGALPFLLCGTINDPVGALFESVSGFTTTGASVLANVEAAPRGILLWRAVTHFIGGMGILVLCVAVIPFLGVGGMQIYRAEMAGPSKDRLTPRIASTAKLLWGIYLLLNVILILLLKVCGMDWFDSVCHSFATLATGGFSTRNISIEAFHNVAIESVIILFMFLGGVNFALHLRFLRGQFLCFARDPEFRLYTLIITTAVIAIVLDRWEGPDTLLMSAHHALFTVVSIITTTGFSTANFDTWPALSKFILLGLMLIGGCAGSTAGGLKNIRVLVLFRQMIREVRRFLQPQAVYQVKVGRQLVEGDIVSTITAFFFIFMAVFVVSSGLMAYITRDLAVSVSAVAAALGNVGPGFGSVGPLENYASMHVAGKSVLILCMLLGRLELYTLLVLLMPSFWKR
jgi:trk system potassium uptake protein TrkH